MTPLLTHKEFAERLHSSFLLHTGTGSSVALKLTEVSEFKQSAVQESFWIVFQGPADKPLGQGTYPFEHSQMGRFDLFITPIRRDQEAFYYEAVFNRLRDSAG